MKWNSEAMTLPMRISYPRGRIVDSYSLIDRGQNPLAAFSLQENIIRKQIGDILFLSGGGERDADASVFFAPEYPNQLLGAMEDALTYYAFGFDQFRDDPVVELRPWDTDLTVIPWERGIGLLSRLGNNQLSFTQQKLVADIMKIDESCKALSDPIDHEQGRRQIGSPWGARFSVKPIVLGYR
jgi:hypothetical protein